jgi:hypothetical protein
MHPLQMPLHKTSRNEFSLGEIASISPAGRRWILALEIFAIAALCAGILITDIKRIRHQNTGDFQHFFFAADAMRHETDPYAAGTRGYIYPPLIAFLFQPLSFLGRNRAAVVMLAINVTVTLLAVALASDEFLRRFKAPRHPAAIAGIVLLALLLNIDKVKGEWQMWQTDVFMLLLFVVALRWLDRLPFAAGIALGIAVNIKYLPLLFLPYLMLRRRWVTTAALLLGVIVFALLPATRTGWHANLQNWKTATNGLLQMTGMQTKANEAAEIHDVRDALSCSVTSALARATNPAMGFALAALTAIIAIGIASWMYHHHGLSIFDHRLAENPAVTATEWAALVAAVLIFGPQTNTRHLFDVLILTSAASVLLLLPRPRLTRLPLLIGITILVLGFILPPGSRTVIGEFNSTYKWLKIGGPCWCLLIAAMTLLWTGIQENIDPLSAGSSRDELSAISTPNTRPCGTALKENQQ